jgi:hypothetical protein
MYCIKTYLFKLMSQTPEIIELKEVFCGTVHLKFSLTDISSIKFQPMFRILESRNLVNR